MRRLGEVEPRALAGVTELRVIGQDQQDRLLGGGFRRLFLLGEAQAGKEDREGGEDACNNSAPLSRIAGSAMETARFQWVIVTHVPMSTTSKSLGANSFGSRMQPWDAASPGFGITPACIPIP